MIDDSHTLYIVYDSHTLCMTDMIVKVHASRTLCPVCWDDNKGT
jgi:hypothetical protein